MILCVALQWLDLVVSYHIKTSLLLKSTAYHTQKNLNTFFLVHKTMIGIFILNSNEPFRLTWLYIIFSSYKHLVYYLFIYVSLQEVLSFNYHGILHASLFSCSSSRSTYSGNYLMSLYTDHYFNLHRSCIHQ